MNFNNYATINKNTINIDLYIKNIPNTALYKAIIICEIIIYTNNYKINIFNNNL